MKKGGPNNVNHIDRENHSIWYHLGTTVVDTIRSMTNRLVTPASIEPILNNIAVNDAHTRSGTIGDGNSFPEFRDEVDEDPALSAFCTQYEAELELDEEIDIGNKKYTHCKPITIDMLLGLFNLVLYALYYYAVTKKALCVFVSSVRSLIFFETVGDSVFNALVSEKIVIGKGLHPNSTEVNLTNKGRYRRSLNEVKLFDEGLALSFLNFDGRTVYFEDDNGLEQSVKFELRSSDALQRVYNDRLTKKNRNELDRRRNELQSMSNKLMAELERKQERLERKQERLEKKQEKLLSLENRVLETQAKQQATLDKNEKKKAVAVAKRKEAEARQNEKMAEEANKRAKRQASAFSELSTSNKNEYLIESLPTILTIGFNLCCCIISPPVQSIVSSRYQLRANLFSPIHIFLSKS